jgi:hypothetical protein
LFSIAAIAARIKKNRPDAASQSPAGRRVRNDAARPLDVFARSITFKAEKPRAFSPATAFLRKGTTQ